MLEVEALNKDNAVDPPTRGECSPSDVLKTANHTIVTGVVSIINLLCGML